MDQATPAAAIRLHPSCRSLVLRIAIISDIHANLEALESFPESYDELWVLGDLVKRDNDRLTDRLRKAEIVIEVQKKLR